MIVFRVVKITNNLDKYPQCREDNEEFPNLVPRVEDEFEIFVVDPRDGGFWMAKEFFECTSTTHFIIDSSEAP